MLLRFLLVCCACFCAFADDVALVRVGESWKYLKGYAEPTYLPTAWAQPSFDDTFWLSGVSGFSANPYIGEATPLYDFPQFYSTVYFRRTFSCTNAAEVQWLTLRVNYDDGFVAYLNGVEIQRANMDGPPGSSVPYWAPATNRHPNIGAEEFDVSAGIPHLVQGTNVLAVEVHTMGSNDVSFAFNADLFANFSRAPFLQDAGTNKMTIVWKTFLPANSELDFGLTTNALETIVQPQLTNTHVVTIANLLPGTTYYYRARSSTADKTAQCALSTFPTIKTGTITFAVIGDTGSGWIPQYNVAEQLSAAASEFVFQVGDTSYPFFTLGLADFHIFSVYEPQMRNTPFFYTIGNHDSYYPGGRQDWLNQIYSPTNSADGSEKYYSFDAGEVHFMALDTDRQAGATYDTNSVQYHWLEQDLANTTKPWKIMLFHHVIRSSSFHRLDDYDGDLILDSLELQSTLGALATKYGAQVIFNGHDHVYERFGPVDGYTSFITGGGGAAAYSLWQLDIMDAQFYEKFHFLKVTVGGDRLETVAIDDAGRVFDKTSIYKAFTPRQIYQATWHRPRFETKPSDDNDGNIIGQRFDFSGDAIPSRTGQFSNMGEFYVNNDNSTLYLGISGAALHGDGNVFLFVEAPGLAGVTNLLAVGNSTIDPQGQGADGLDFLKNVAFTNFAPGIACVLGDEFADGQFRSFTRPLLGLDIGQGVFRLDQNLTDVPSQIQQFNRSPQDSPIAGERNADFIKIAIPFTALGNLQPGAKIRIGAIAGGPNFDTNTFTRQIDTAVLGYGLTGSGMEPVVLEGVEVQLASDEDPDGDGLSTAEEGLLGTDPARADSDGDGLLDGWEVLNGLNPLSASGRDGGSGDADNDGMSNLAEQAAGTDPLDARSVLRLNLHIGANLVFVWATVPGKQYALESGPAATGIFETVDTFTAPLLSATNSAQISRPQIGNAPAMFFRLRILP